MKFLFATLLALTVAGMCMAVAPPSHSSALNPSAKIHRTVANALESDPDAAPVWVIFRDKGLIDHNTAFKRLETHYHERAIRRRQLRRTAPNLFDERDLDLWEPYIKAVTATGARLRIRSRWLNALSVSASAGQIQQIAKLPFVEQVQAVQRHGRPDSQDLPKTINASKSVVSGAFYGQSEAQLALVNLIALHDEGFTGEGIVIGVLDTGFSRTHVAFNNLLAPLDIVAEYDFLESDTNTGIEFGDFANQHDHGTLVLGTMAANLPGTLVGAAYDASYILAKAEDITGEYSWEEDLFVAGLEFIEANGGDIATSSLIANGLYTQAQLDGATSIMTIGYSVASENGLICFQGAGNSGHDANPATSTILAPADAPGVISVGAVNISGSLASFTSDGPTADGRVKPEILNMGVSSMTTDSFDNLLIIGVSGTSFAAPLTAGAAACILQKHPDWNVTQMRAALFQTATTYQATGTYDPLFVSGYGIIDVHGASQMSPNPADLNEDFVVNILDLLEVLSHWGPCPVKSLCPQDFDGNDAVDILDLLTVLINWD